MRRSGKGQLLEDRKKDVIRLMKRYNKLRDLRGELPLVPLPKPVRSGWERVFVVREDVKKGPHGKFLEGLLTKINSSELCRDKAFTRLNWKTGKVGPIEQDLKCLSEEEYNALSPQEKAQFERTVRIVKYWFETKPVTVYVVKQPWRFVFKIKPYFLTHAQTVDGEIESELDKISNKLFKYGYVNQYLEHGSYDDDWGEPLRKAKEALYKKELEEAW